MADLSDHGLEDLVLIYSRVAHHPSSSLPAPTDGTKVYRARQAMLRVVSPAGTTLTTSIHRAWAANLLSVAQLNNEPGKEILLQLQVVSSGQTEAMFSLHAGRLISAGVALGSGGDSASAAGFECLPGNPPQLIQRQYELVHGLKVIHGEIYGVWRETDITYRWQGPWLQTIARHTFNRRERPNAKVGASCTKGTS